MLLLYDEEKVALTKERLEDLRRKEKLSFDQLAKKLGERGTRISHTNLKNYEINDPLHPLYGRTKSMSIEYLVALADYYDVSVDYLLGLSPMRKQEHHDIAEQLGLCESAVAELIRYNQRSASSYDMYHNQYTEILNDLFTSIEFEYTIEKLREAIEYYRLHQRSHKIPSQIVRESNQDTIEQACETVRHFGYTPVESDLLVEVCIERAIGELTNFLRQMPKRLYDEYESWAAQGNQRKKGLENSTDCTTIENA